MTPTRRRTLPFLVAIQLLLTATPWLVLRFWPLPDGLLEPVPRSLQILDRHGVLLRDVPAADAHQWAVPLSEVSPWFLEALVVAGPTCWGGEPGLTRLSERFGAEPLLVAARIAERLDRKSRDPRGTLELARSA